MARAAKQPDTAPEVPAQEALADAEKQIFGKNVLRDATGAPMERGHGSNFAKLRHADRSHYLTLSATADSDKAGELCATLSGIITRLMEAQKGARAAAEKAAEDAAVAEVAANQAKGEIDALNNQLATAKQKILELTAELAKAKEA